MIVLKTLLSQLGRADVSEVVMQSGRPPALRVGGALTEVEQEPLSTDGLVALLFSAGGSRYVDSLGARPTQWRTRVEGVGAVVVSATQNGEAIEARFSLRDPPAAKPRVEADVRRGSPASGRSQAMPASKGSRARSQRGEAMRVKAPRSAHAEPVVPPRPHRAARIDAPPPPPAHDDDDAHTPPPTPMRRGELPTLPSEVEVSIGPGAIPSVPRAPTPEPNAVARAREPKQAEIALVTRGAIPMQPRSAADLLEEVIAAKTKPQPRTAPQDEGPTSPRTLPEARFERNEPEPMVRRPTPIAIAGVAPPSAPEEVSARRHAPHTVGVATTPGPGMTELTEPFTPSVRQPDPSPPAHPLPRDAQLRAASRSASHALGADGGPPRAPGGADAPAPSEPRPHARGRAPSGRTTRPFEREPRTQELRALLRAAREARASDLHIMAGRPPLLRVAGQIIESGGAIGARVVEDMLLSRIPARLAPAFERDGSCDFALTDQEHGRFRVHVARQRTGLWASMRLVALEIPTLEGLGLPDVVGQATRHKSGLIVFSGPLGHGKTSTMAAFVDLLNRETARHVITLEDPIEHLFSPRKGLVSQREIGAHARSFEAGLRAALREDPDVIVVGELRDAEAVRAAMAACEAGHLVLGTMSAPSAARTIDRILDHFPPAEQGRVRATLAGGLQMIVCQRLLPDVECKRMVAACEVLPGMAALSTLIRDGRTYQIPSLQQRGKAFGVVRLDESLAELVRAGRIPPAAAIAVAEAPDELEQALGVRRPSERMMRPVAPPGQPAASDPRATSPLRPPEPHGAEPQPGRGGFFERAGALFGGRKDR